MYNKVDEKEIEVFRNLLKEKKYATLRGKARDMNVIDVATIMEAMEDEDMLKMFRLFPKELAADVFAELEDDSQQYIITQLSEKEAGVVIDNLYADDAADLLEEMPANVVKKLLANAQPDTRAYVNHLLQYEEDTAGSIMTVEFVDLKEDMTVRQAIERIRKVGMDSETIDTCYVLNPKRLLLGTIAIRALILNEPDAVIGNLMQDDPISVITSADQEVVAHIFQKYDFTAMPVVDKENRMVGIITVDDVMDIIQQEATEDMDKMAGILPSDKPYLKTGVFATWKKRIPWLLLLMISATFTGSIITSFEDALSKFVVLTAYIPMLMGTCGNAGSQASTEVVRALSLGEATPKDYFRIVWKEMRVGMICGITLAVCNFIKSITFDGLSPQMALVISLTIVLAVFISKIVASTIVLIISKLNLDPAVVASPMLATFSDALSLLLYFSIASRILHL